MRRPKCGVTEMLSLGVNFALHFDFVWAPDVPRDLGTLIRTCERHSLSVIPVVFLHISSVIPSVFLRLPVYFQTKAFFYETVN